MKHYYPDASVVTDADGIPAVIVAVHEGEPLTLPVSEETLNLFNAVRQKLNLQHVVLANKLRDRICSGGGQFHENSVGAWLLALNSGSAHIN